MPDNNGTSQQAAVDSLSSRVQAAELKLASEVKRLEEHSALTAKLLALEEKLVLLDKARETDSKNLDAQIALYKTLVDKSETLKQETKTSIFRMVTVATAFAAACALIGAATIKSTLQSSVSDQSKKVAARISPLIDYEYNYAQGTGYLSNKQFPSAILRLSECFKSKPYDEAVLVPLLQAIDGSDNWSQGKVVVDRLMSDKAAFYAISGAVPWNMIGVVDTDVGALHSEYFPFAREALYRARDQVLANDTDTQKVILENLWILDVLTGRSSDAKQTATNLVALIKADKTGRFEMDSWEKIANFRIFNLPYVKDAIPRKQARQMWQEVDKAYKDSLAARRDQP